MPSPSIRYPLHYLVVAREDKKSLKVEYFTGFDEHLAIKGVIDTPDSVIWSDDIYDALRLPPLDLVNAQALAESFKITRKVDVSKHELSLLIIKDLDSTQLVLHQIPQE